MMEAVITSEASVNFYENTRHKKLEANEHLEILHFSIIRCVLEQLSSQVPAATDAAGMCEH